MNPRTGGWKGGRPVITASLVVAALGVVAAVVGGFVDRRQLCFSYLTAWASAVFLSVGALCLLLTCHAMRAGWPTAVRRLLEAMVAPLPVLAALFVPVLLAVHVLYPWAHLGEIGDERARRVIEHKAPYLNPGFFTARAGIYFALWIVMATILRRWSFRQDREPGVDLRGRMYVFSGYALPIMALTIVFSSFDWLMSLEATWYSTMFPIYVFAGGFVAAIAGLTILTYAAERAGYLEGLDESHYYALGRLLLAFTIFWAYAAFFQFMLIWIADKPDEVSYFLERWVGPWRATSALLVFGRFIGPFLALMPYAIKRHPRQLTGMAIWIVVAHYVDVHWMVVPVMRQTGFPYHWLDLGTLAIVCGLSVAYAAWRHEGRPVVPVHDPRLEEAFAYRSV